MMAVSWDDPYWRRRIVSFVCFFGRMYKWDRAKVYAKAAARKPPYPQAWIDAAWPIAQRACKNATLVSVENCPDRSIRLCDVPGLQLCPDNPRCENVPNHNRPDAAGNSELLGTSDVRDGAEG